MLPILIKFILYLIPFIFGLRLLSGVDNYGLWSQYLGAFLMITSVLIPGIIEEIVLDFSYHIQKIQKNIKKRRERFFEKNPHKAFEGKGNIYYPDFKNFTDYIQSITELDSERNVFFKVIYFPLKIIYGLLILAGGIFFPLVGLIWCIHFIFYKLKKLVMFNKKIIFHLVPKEFIKGEKSEDNNLNSPFPKGKTIFIKLRIKDAHLYHVYIKDAYESYEVNGISIYGFDKYHHFESWMLGNGKSILNNEIYLLPSGTKLYPKLIDLTPSKSEQIDELNINTNNLISSNSKPDNFKPVNQSIKSIDKHVVQPNNQNDNNSESLYNQFRELVKRIFSKEFNKIVIDCSKYPNYLEDYIQKAVELKRTGSFNEAIKIYLEIIRNENKVFPEVLTYLYKSVLCTGQLDFAYETILLAEDFIKRCWGTNSIEVPYYEEKRFEFEEILKKIKQITLPGILVVNTETISSEDFLKNHTINWLKSYSKNRELLRNFISPYSGGANIIIPSPEQIDQFLINCNEISLLYKKQALF